MDQIDKEKLTRPFPQSAIKQRPVQGKRLDYVEGHTVIHRLNEATGNRWDFKVLNLDSIDLGTDWRLVTATVELTIPGLGSRQHIGVQSVHVKGEDMVKGAITDALKKAATLFGVGLELYGPDYEAGELDAKPSPENRPTPRPNPPQTANAPANNREDEEPAIVSWTVFWEEARKLGIATKEKYVELTQAEMPPVPQHALNRLRKTIRERDAALKAGQLVTAEARPEGEAGFDKFTA